MSCRSRKVPVALTVTALVLAAPALQSAGATAEPPRVLVSQVSTDPEVSAGEAWVTTNPRNPSQVIVIWLGTTGDITRPEAFLSSYCGVGRSTDGGRTWQRSKLPLTTTTGAGAAPEAQPAGRMFPVCGDPMTGVGPDGTLYGAAVQLGSTSFTQSVTSFDFGAHWSAPVQVFGVQQTQAATVANLGSAKTIAIGEGRGFMAVDAVTGEISMHSQEDGAAEGRWLSVSSDRGATWSVPRPLDPDVQSKSAGALSAAAGTIAVAYVVDPTSPTYLSSTHPAVTCATACTVFETTTDRGVTWARHVMSHGGGTGAGIGPGHVSLVAADPIHRGRFAVLLWSTDGRSLQLWRTDNRGVSWRMTKLATATEGDTLAMPGMAYSPTGTLGVVWRRQHSAGPTDVLARVSPDGGTSFSAPVTLAKDIPPDTQVTPGDDCACNLHLDTHTLAATWTATVSRQRQVFLGRFDYTHLKGLRS